MLSFSNEAKCKPRQDVPQYNDVNENRFYQQMVEEDGCLRAYHAKEIQSTLENPVVHAQFNDTEICGELRALKSQQFLEQKRRQALRANNEELRILDAQLRRAYVTKELVEQQAAHEYSRQAARRERQEEAKHFEEERLCTQAAIAAKEAQEQQNKLNRRVLLHEQMDAVRAERLKQYEQVLHDREDMMKLVQRLKREEAAERELLKERRRCQRQEVDEYLRNRELFKQNQQAENLQEHDKYTELRKQREEEEHAAAKAKRHAMSERIAANERIGQKNYQIEMEKQNRSTLLVNLLVEERKAVEDMKHRLNLQRQVQQRNQTIRELHFEREKQIRDRLKPGEMSAEDKLFFEEQMKQLAERDKLEQLTNEKRRRMLQEHRRALLALIDVRKAERAQRVSENLFLDSAERRNECKRLQDVSVERNRMLQQHAADVLRYLPNGVLKGDERKLLQSTNLNNDLNKK